jgi:hypothetical protein
MSLRIDDFRKLERDTVNSSIVRNRLVTVATTMSAFSYFSADIAAFCAY